jgi:hypothetical protein
MMLQCSTDHNQTIQKERDSMKDAYQKSIVKVLMAHDFFEQPRSHTNDIR